MTMGITQRAKVCLDCGKIRAVTEDNTQPHVGINLFVLLQLPAAVNVDTTVCHRDGEGHDSLKRCGTGGLTITCLK